MSDNNEINFDPIYPLDGEFTVWYDSQPDEVIDAISKAIALHGFTIEDIADGEGWVGYRVVGE